MGRICSTHDDDKKYIHVHNFVGNPEGISGRKKADKVTGALKNKCEK
jgi:hypothetical protein